MKRRKRRENVQNTKTTRKTEVLGKGKDISWKEKKKLGEQNSSLAKTLKASLVWGGAWKRNAIIFERRENKNRNK